MKCVVLRERIELSASPLPRECSATELPQLIESLRLLPYPQPRRKSKPLSKTENSVYEGAYAAAGFAA